MRHGPFGEFILLFDDGASTVLSAISHHTIFITLNQSQSGLSGGGEEHSCRGLPL